MTDEQLPPPSAPKPPTQTEPTTGDTAEVGTKPVSKTKGVVQVLVGAFVLIVLASIIWPNSDDDRPSADDIRYSAFETCTEFVRQRLKAPSTASFRNYFQNDGEVVISGTGNGPYTVRSTVDAENSFGAAIRSDFTCVLRLSGDTWQLTDITID